ncbi:MAG: cob(I)yrinic acid a,c-diamide adenosyltransferase, partial [candidate division Zixibacteria bacterium]
MTVEKPSLLVVYTGNGKGKTTAALGMCLRAVGYNWRICLIQFVKGTWKYGELEGVKRLSDNVELHVIGTGFVGILDDNKPIEEHQEAAKVGIDLALEKLEDDRHQLIILDELNVALDLNLVSKEQVQSLLDARSVRCHMVITGRAAPDWLIEQADLVTEMKEIKHPFESGRKA